MTSSTGRRRTVLIPGDFAQQIGGYLWHLVENAGGDRSGRWLESRTDLSKTYWSKILNLTQAMTTNDVAVTAGLFGRSPYEFIREARTFARANQSGEIIEGRFGVRGDPEDVLDAVARQRETEPTDEQ